MKKKKFILSLRNVNNVYFYIAHLSQKLFTPFISPLEDEIKKKKNKILTWRDAWAFCSPLNS